MYMPTEFIFLYDMKKIKQKKYEAISSMLE